MAGETATTTSPPGGADEEELVAEEAFGFERAIQSSSFLVTVNGAGDADELDADDFDVYSDDGRAGQPFARVASVVPLTAREASVRVEVDLGCHAGLEGGEFMVTTVYKATSPWIGRAGTCA